MLNPSGKLVLQGLLVLQVTASDTRDCCPVKQQTGPGSLSGTYILVSNSSGNLVNADCRDSCGYVKDDHPDPEQLFCFKFDQTLETDVKCQEDSPFAPQRTDDISVPLLSLTQAEGEELLRISKDFPPPPEGDIVDVCVQGGIAFSLHINATSSNGDCNLILLDENSQTKCEEVWNICKYGTTPAATETGTTQKGTLITAHETESATERETPHITHTETLSTGTESTTTSVAPSLEPGQEPAGPGPTPSALPSWSLKWCPRRIQGNPNRLRRFPQCCFHPITRRPRGNLWVCLNKYYRRQS